MICCPFVTGNHSCEPNAEVTFPYNNSTLVLVAMADISENEVCTTCSSRLLLHDRNPFNSPGFAGRRLALTVFSQYPGFILFSRFETRHLAELDRSLASISMVF